MTRKVKPVSPAPRVAEDGWLASPRSRSTVTHQYMNFPAGVQCQAGYWAPISLTFHECGGKVSGRDDVPSSVGACLHL